MGRRIIDYEEWLTLGNLIFVTEFKINIKYTVLERC